MKIKQMESKRMKKGIRMEIIRMKRTEQMNRSIKIRFDQSEHLA